MKLNYDPLSYLRAVGTPRHSLELSLAGFGLERPRVDILTEIKAQQNADGSFAGSRVPGVPGSVPTTAKTVALLAAAGEKIASQKGAVWLAAAQRENGGYTENDALAASLKPEWEWFSTKNPITWITGEVMAALAAVGGFGPQVNRARDFLFRARNRGGGWPGQVAADYPIRTDLWTIGGVVRGLLAAGVAANHAAFEGLGPALARQIDRWRNPIENPLPSFLALGRRTSDPEVQECATLLHDTQNADGGWPYLAEGESHPNPTAELAAVLARYRLASW